MDRFADLHKERMAALLRAVYATKYVKDDNVPSQIEEGLYLGSVGAANNKTLLKSLNITHILTVASSLPPAYPNDFSYKIIDVHDREEVNITQFFDDSFGFINEAKRAGGVLVHCFVGRSRSVTIVVAYLMKKHGMSASEALNLVKSKRSVAAPNSGFMLQLQKYEKSLSVYGRRRVVERMGEDGGSLTMTLVHRMIEIYEYHWQLTSTGIIYGWYSVAAVIGPRILQQTFINFVYRWLTLIVEPKLRWELRFWIIIIIVSDIVVFLTKISNIMLKQSH